MKILIVEDDVTSRVLLEEVLRKFGKVHTAADGSAAVDAFGNALAVSEPFDLICLDIMLPELDGREVLRQIRGMEEAAGITSTHGAKIVMTTALDHVKSVTQSFHGLCDAYLCKPVDKGKLVALLRRFQLA